MNPLATPTDAAKSPTLESALQLAPATVHLDGLVIADARRHFNKAVGGWLWRFLNTPAYSDQQFQRRVLKAVYDALDNWVLHRNVPAGQVTLLDRNGVREVQERAVRGLREYRTADAVNLCLAVLQSLPAQLEGKRISLGMCILTAHQGALAVVSTRPENVSSLLEPRGRTPKPSA
jgi:hypothetical protein